MARRLLADVMPDGQFNRASLLLAVSVLISFLSLKPIIFITLVALLLFFVALSERESVSNKIAAFALFAIVFPPISYTLGNLGDLNQLTELRVARLGAMILLVPAALQLFARPTSSRPAWLIWTDSLFFAYYALRIILNIPHSPATLILRTTVESTIDTLIPYYVFSRGLHTQEEIKKVLAWMGLGFIFAASVALIEFAGQRNLYAELQGIYGVTWQLTLRLTRGAYLRTQAMTPQPLVLGFLLVYGATCTAIFFRAGQRKFSSLLTLGAFTAAILTTFSRGPIVGAFVAIAVLLALRTGKAMRFKFGVLGVVAAAVVLRILGLDNAAVMTIGGMLGGGAAGLQTIDYRQELLDTSLALIKQSPWFGVPNYAYYMQGLRQGEGIIDLVNSFLAIALDAGLVGLAMYILPFVIIANQLLNKLTHAENAPEAQLGRFANNFVALICASLVMIFTTSTFAVMPFLLLVLIAVPIAWLRQFEPKPDLSKPWLNQHIPQKT
jgi:O-antigen ligase